MVKTQLRETGLVIQVRQLGQNVQSGESETYFQTEKSVLARKHVVLARKRGIFHLRIRGRNGDPIGSELDIG